jgi:hypothetical protein
MRADVWALDQDAAILDGSVVRTKLVSAVFSLFCAFGDANRAELGKALVDATFPGLDAPGYGHAPKAFGDTLSRDARVAVGDASPKLTIGSRSVFRGGLAEHIRGEIRCRVRSFARSIDLLVGNAVIPVH